MREEQQATLQDSNTEKVETYEMKRFMLEKTKNIVREVCLYFIDWVIE